MKAINKSSIIVPINKNRDIKGYCIYDLMTLKYRVVNFVESTKNPAKDKELTALYYNKKYKAYGVVRDTENCTKPMLIWIKEKDLEILKSKVLNYDSLEEVITISEKDEDSFNSNNTKKMFSKVKFVELKNTSSILAFGNSTNREKFISEEPKKTIEITVGDSNIIAENSDDEMHDDDNDIVENEEIVEENNNNEDGSREEPTEEVKDTVEEFDFIKASHDTLAEMLDAIKDLKDTKEQYRNALSQINGSLNNIDSEKLIGVTRVVNEDTNDEDYDSALYSVYDTILKLMKVNDSISVPRVYYEHLAVTIHRNIFLSRSGEKYEAIVKIKVATDIKDNMIARVEYDSTQKYTRISVIKELNATEISESDIIDYEVRYNEWRKHNNFSVV